MADSGVLNVAIAGAGIAGLAAAIALRQHPRVNVQIYEQTEELKEIGASIALGPNGMRTLERLGVYNALDDNIGFRGPSKFPMIYRHWKTNEVVSVDVHKGVVDPKHETTRFHRAHLHQALLDYLPKDIIHLRKKVSDVQADPQKGVILQFEDGSSISADLLIGADGIHSNVRKAFVPDHKLAWTGWVAYRSVFPTSLVEGISDLPEDSAHWWSPDERFFASKLGKSQYTAVGGFTVDPTDPKVQHLIERTHWDDEGDLDYLRSLYKDWHPVVQSVLAASPYTRVYPNRAGAALSNYTFQSRVVLIGDAAHTHGGAFAAGGSLALDDAFALSLALQTVIPADPRVAVGAADLERALKLYEDTRQPHTTRVLETVQKNVEMATARLRRGERDDDQQLRKRMKERTDTSWIHEHDVVATFNRALASQEGDANVARL